ncbi:MAG: RIP metalloprotease RseP [Bacteroidales bacterium]|nr:RIP metalloprotease RseP [Bacteroidales bacterium]
MNEVLIKILQFIASISILVIVHELGHFLFAKIFKTRIEKFYLFFNPWFSLYKKKIGETEYGIGWLPLGGYVKIAGMIDESFDKEQLKKPPQPYEFRSKKAWQRLLILLGGIIFNVLLAFFIYSTILLLYGEKYLPNDALKYGIMTDSLGTLMGLKNGDKIVSLDYQKVDNFKKITHDILLNDIKTIQVLRNGKLINVMVSDSIKKELIKNPFFIEARIPFIIDDFLPESVAKKAGLKQNDKIIAINNVKTQFYDEVRMEIKNNKNKEVIITVLRNEKDTLFFKLKVPPTGLIGVIPITDYEKFFDLKAINYNLLTCIPAGIAKTYEITISYIKQFKLLFSPETEAYKSVGGFISIGKIFPSEWDWVAFFSLTAFLSVILAFMNILPIPGLDGGHTLFVLWEMLTGKKPSDKFLELAQIIGFSIIILIILFANANDIIKLLK